MKLLVQFGFDELSRQRGEQDEVVSGLRRNGLQERLTSSSQAVRLMPRKIRPKIALNQRIGI